MQNERNKYELHPALLAYMYPIARPDVKVPETSLKPYVVCKDGVLQTPAGAPIVRTPKPAAPKEINYKVKLNGRQLVGAKVDVYEKQINITSAGSERAVKPVAKSHKKAVKK
jgi:hypothetical protein